MPVAAAPAAAIATQSIGVSSVPRILHPRKGPWQVNILSALYQSLVGGVVGIAASLWLQKRSRPAGKRDGSVVAGIVWPD